MNQVTLAGLLNALKVVGKKKEEVKIVTVGAGSAGIAIAKMLLSAGFKNITMCDKQGALYVGCPGMNWAQAEMAALTNPEQTPEGGNNAEQIALRKRLTTQRARIVVLVFIFAIVGTDIVVVALRRKNDAELQVEAAGAMDEALDASEPVSEPSQQGGEQTPEA